MTGRVAIFVLFLMVPVVYGAPTSLFSGANWPRSQVPVTERTFFGGAGWAGFAISSASVNANLIPTRDNVEKIVPSAQGRGSSANPISHQQEGEELVPLAQSKISSR